MKSLTNFFVFTVLVILGIRNSYCNAELVSPEVVAALRVAINYYNQTMSLMEETEMLKKYIDYAKEEGMLRSIKSRLFDDLTENYDELKDLIEEEEKEVYNPTEYLKMLAEIESDLKQYFRVEDESFVDNNLELFKLKEYYNTLLEHLEEFKQTQMSLAKKHYHVLFRNGIKLGDNEKPLFMFITDESNFAKLLGKGNGGSEDQKNVDEAFSTLMKESRDFSELKIEFPPDQPRQTSHEILSLQKAMDGHSIDQTTLNFLEGFVAEMNEKLHIFIKKLLNVEEIIEEADKAFEEYQHYYPTTKELFLQDIEKLKKKLETKNKRWQIRKNFETDRHEL